MIRLSVWYESDDGLILCFAHAVDRVNAGEGVKTIVDQDDGEWPHSCHHCLNDDGARAK